MPESGIALAVRPLHGLCYCSSRLLRQCSQASREHHLDDPISEHRLDKPSSRIEHTAARLSKSDCSKLQASESCAEQCLPQPGHQPELNEAQGACEVQQGGKDQRHEAVDSSQANLDLQRGKQHISGSTDGWLTGDRRRNAMHDAVWRLPRRIPASVCISLGLARHAMSMLVAGPSRQQDMHSQHCSHESRTASQASRQAYQQRSQIKPCCSCGLVPGILPRAQVRA